KVMSMKQWRFLLLLIFFMVAAIALASRLFYLQVLNGKFYQAQALGQQVGFEQVYGRRGEIFFQDSQQSHGIASTGDTKSLAIDKDKWLISAVPKIIKDKVSAAGILASYLDQSKESLLTKLNAPTSYVVLQKDLSPQQVAGLKNVTINGVSLESSPARYYPQQQMLGQVVGFLGGDGTGQYGLEGYYDSVLKGETGIQEKSAGLTANLPADYDGSDLDLTIDYNIQFQAESLLQEAHDSIDIDSGQ